MTVEEFAQGPAQSGILADRECVSLFLHFTVNPKPPVGFLDVPRCSMTGKEQTVCRFQQIESRWGYSGTADKIRFVTSLKILGFSGKNLTWKIEFYMFKKKLFYEAIFVELLSGITLKT